MVSVFFPTTACNKHALASHIPVPQPTGLSQKAKADVWPRQMSSTTNWLVRDQAVWELVLETRETLGLFNAFCLWTVLKALT
ncbi:unnamed protein product [Scytosiphon promiscuus]